MLQKIVVGQQDTNSLKTDELEEVMINYSPSETRVLKLLRAKPQSTIALCERYYYPQEPPFNGRVIVVGILSSLKRKAEINQDSFRIRKSERAGPNPIKFWIEK